MKSLLKRAGRHMVGLAIISVPIVWEWGFSSRCNTLELSAKAKEEPGKVASDQFHKHLMKISLDDVERFGNRIRALWKADEQLSSSSREQFCLLHQDFDDKKCTITPSYCAILCGFASNLGRKMENLVLNDAHRTTRNYCVVLVSELLSLWGQNVINLEEFAPGKIWLEKNGSLENKWADQHVFVESDDASISFVMKYIIRPTDLVDIVEDVGNRMVEEGLCWTTPSKFALLQMGGMGCLALSTISITGRTILRKQPLTIPIYTFLTSILWYWRIFSSEKRGVVLLPLTPKGQRATSFLQEKLLQMRSKYHVASADSRNRFHSFPPYFYSAPTLPPLPQVKSREGNMENEGAVLHNRLDQVYLFSCGLCCASRPYSTFPDRLLMGLVRLHADDAEVAPGSTIASKRAEREAGSRAHSNE